MIKHEIKRAMFANLKEQLNNYHLRDACQKGDKADAVRFYDDKISKLDSDFDELIQLYQECYEDYVSD